MSTSPPFTYPAASVAFIDLATFSEQEGFLYGGPTAITWFVRGVQKANWASVVPIVLRSQGIFNFGQRNASACLNRSGDYVLAVWFRVFIPQVSLGVAVNGVPPANIFNDATIRWTRNLMHNIFDRVNITFNELTVEEFDNFWLDQNYQFRLRGSKRVGYRNMIGDIGTMTTPVGPGVALGPGQYFSCPLPFWFTEDSGVALPIAAIPFNDVKINYSFNALADLIVVNGGTAAAGPFGASPGTISEVVVFGQPNTIPSFQDPQTFAHYAVVHNDERVKMGDAPRDMLIKQVQIVQQAPFKDVTTNSSFDLRLSHSAIAFFYAAQNVSTQGEQSNYSTAPGGSGVDPIAFSALLYESTVRVAMGSDYFSLMVPYLQSSAIPEDTGYHMWSYALDAWLYNPCFSTNYSKLANVSIVHTMSPACVNSASTVAPVDQFGVPITHNVNGVTVPFPQTYQHNFELMNWNIGRVANGSFGQPTL